MVVVVAVMSDCPHNCWFNFDIAQRRCPSPTKVSVCGGMELMGLCNCWCC